MKKFLKSLLISIFNHIVFVLELYQKLDSKQREKLWINLMIVVIIISFFFYIL